mmetsp:Transcript_28/g.116  ORF Transcript_28/g.116 Transcript_28/m.116 type:complete len:606 (-) Transcript_28:62-1879(-)|eukprot:CAMPEP_0117451530 /NCGR_PEP_ID=MMETSP0759-20121206/9060_1 /TAXON_ID=63605 /ORGANISM="Percolomonas cosmopolitus, Strain WS" /LENGTH=605 /DNA_ID=CAMNT_0005244143 /DNA_START=31 /DNA_END=1848 /DNA_ORIENTATION=+
MNSLFSSFASPSSPKSQSNQQCTPVESYLGGSWHLHDENRFSDESSQPRQPHQSLHFKTTGNPTKILQISSALPHRKDPQSTYVPWKCVNASLDDADFQNLMVKRGMVQREEIKGTLEKDNRCTLLIGREIHADASSTSEAIPDHEMQRIPIQILSHDKYSLFDSIILKSTDAREKRFIVGALKCSLHGHVMHISFFHGRFESGDMIHIHCGFYRSYIKRYRVMKSEGCIKIDLRAYKKYLGPLFCKYVHRRKVVGISNAIFHGPPIKLRTIFASTDNSLHVYWSSADKENRYMSHIPDDFELSKFNPWIALFAKESPNYYSFSHSYLQFQYMSPGFGEQSGHVLFANIPPEAYEARLFIEGYYDAANSVIKRDSKQLDEIALEREHILDSVIGLVTFEPEESIIIKIRSEMEEIQKQKSQLEKEVQMLRCHIEEIHLMQQNAQTEQSDSASHESNVVTLKKTVFGLQHQIAELEQQLEQEQSHHAQSNEFYQQQVSKMQSHLKSVIVEKKTIEQQLVLVKKEQEERSEISSVDSSSSLHSAQTLFVPGSSDSPQKHKRSMKLRKNFKSLLQKKLRGSQHKRKSSENDDVQSVQSDNFSVAPTRM